MPFELNDDPKRIGFVATRIAGTDGVSLEIGKWVEVLQRMGHSCYYIAGISDRSDKVSRIIPESRFKHPVIEEINKQVFGRELRTPDLTGEIHEMTWVIKQKLHTILDELKLDLYHCRKLPDDPHEHSAGHRRCRDFDGNWRCLYRASSRFCLGARAIYGQRCRRLSAGRFSASAAATLACSD